MIGEAQPRADPARSVREARSWRGGGVIAWLLVRLGAHAGLLVILACFAATTLIVPTMMPIATTDDWGYTRSVEILLDEGRLTIFPVVAATAVFQVLWGALFGLIFGMSLGMMRVATLVMVALGGLALYWLCRQLGVSRGRSALGVATYLFNPLVFVLAFTFMTDPHFTSLLVISTAFYVRGLDPEKPLARATVVGSMIAGAAFLTRQQGVLIPMAVVGYLILSRRLRPNLAGLRLLLQVVGAPVLTTVGYYLWLRFFNEIPTVQQSFLRGIRAAGIERSWELFRYLTFFEIAYLGFFALPIAAAAIPAVRSAVRSMPTRGWLLFLLWQGVLIAGLGATWAQGRRMPYIGQFFGRGGLGPPDVRGSRPILLEMDVRTWLTLAVAAGAILTAFFVCRRLLASASPSRSRAALIVALAGGQIAGMMPPSYHYLDRNYSLDRYLLPLAPLGICLLLWAVRDLRLFQPAAWVLIAGMAAFSVAGTRDYLVFMGSTWDLARAANAAGIANVHLDAGASWGGYHLYTYGLDNNITRARTRDGPWWLTFYAKATDSTYVVSSGRLDGYVTICSQPYSSWLQAEETQHYLLRRRSVTETIPRFPSYPMFATPPCHDLMSEPEQPRDAPDPEPEPDPATDIGDDAQPLPRPPAGTSR